MTMHRYGSLEDYLQSRPLDVDGLLHDGFGAVFPVKGRLIDAAVLFVDMSRFSTRTSSLSPIETLVLANNFFAWVSAEGIEGRPAIVDKYIGDEVMVVYSKDFGSKDPLADAVNGGRWMAERDHIGFCPHIGIAAGQVVVGYVGTPLKYNCSVYGEAVTLAQRCCQIRAKGFTQASIIVPASVWGGRKLEEVLTKRKMKGLDGGEFEMDFDWRILPARKEAIKGGQELEVIEISRKSFIMPPEPPEQRARRAFEGLQREGSYRPRRYEWESASEGFQPGTKPDGTA